jgi:hypothetical protein
MADEIQDIDAAVFKDTLERLLEEAANMLERDFPPHYQKVRHAHIIFFSRMRITINTYEAILNLTATADGNPLRKPLVFATAPLVRSLFEELATLLFMLHDIPNLMVSFECGAYTELWQERRASQKYYGKIPKWKTYIAGLDKKLEEIADEIKLTKAQRQNPIAQKLQWPTPGRKMLQIIKIRYPESPALSFMEFLNSWMYRTLSRDSHLNLVGVQRRGLYFTPRLAKQMFGEKDYKRILQERWEGYHKDMLWTTYTILLSIVSEIEAHFSYGMKVKAKYLWTIFEAHSEMAKDFYDMRYKALLV